MEIEKLQSAIEAILFTMGDSVEISKLAFAIGHDEETTKKLVRNMMERYEKEDRGIRIIELEDSFQLCTKKEMYEYLIRVAKQPKRYALTDVLLETLSIVAYKQPVTKLEIEKIRGVKCNTIVIGLFAGKENAFLIQNTFPVIEKYFDHVHTIQEQPVTIHKKLDKVLVENLNEVLAMYNRGIKLTFTGIKAIRNIMEEELGK